MSASFPSARRICPQASAEPMASPSGRACEVSTNRWRCSICSRTARTIVSVPRFSMPDAGRLAYAWSGLEAPRPWLYSLGTCRVQKLALAVAADAADQPVHVGCSPPRLAILPSIQLPRHHPHPLKPALAQIANLAPAAPPSRSPAQSVDHSILLQGWSQSPPAMLLPGARDDTSAHVVPYRSPRSKTDENIRKFPQRKPYHWRSGRVPTATDAISYRKSTNESTNSAPPLFATRVAWRSTFLISPSR